MTQDEQLIAELQKINKKLDILSNPFKNAGYNFISGIWRSLGSLFGTVVIAAVIVYILSRFNITSSIMKYFKNLLPSQINISQPFLQPEPGQL